MGDFVAVLMMMAGMAVLGWYVAPRIAYRYGFSGVIGFGLLVVGVVMLVLIVAKDVVLISTQP